jgi:hypothetical protein
MFGFRSSYFPTLPARRRVLGTRGRDRTIEINWSTPTFNSSRWLPQMCVTDHENPSRSDTKARQWKVELQVSEIWYLTLELVDNPASNTGHVFGDATCACNLSSAYPALFRLEHGSDEMDLFPLYVSDCCVALDKVDIDTLLVQEDIHVCISTFLVGNPFFTLLPNMSQRSAQLQWSDAIQTLVRGFGRCVHLCKIYNRPTIPRRSSNPTRQESMYSTVQ